MTDKELKQTIQDLTKSIDKLTNSDKPLTGIDKRRKQILSLRKEILQQIKEARAKNDSMKERDLTLDYGLLSSMGEKHPYLIGLLRSKFKWQVF